MIRKQIEQAVISAFQTSFGRRPESIELTNPDSQFGDFALACHPYAKELKTPPAEIAEKLAQAVSGGMIAQASAAAGYLNITIDAAALAKEVIAGVMQHDKSYGSFEGKKEKAVIEYSSPNTNKPLHLGHIRNNVLGISVANLLRARDAQVRLVQCVNDRGIHIIKSMLAYQKWGEGKIPEEAAEKGDHFVGKFYVLFEKEFEREWQDWLKENPEVPGLSDDDRARRRQEFFGESRIGAEAQEMLRAWEAADKNVRALWKRMNEWVYDGFKETYKKLGSEFDKNYYESETYLLGKDIIKDGLSGGVFVKDKDGSVWADLTDSGLDRKLVQRTDGTSVYITQDLGLAVSRYNETGFDRMIYVVGHEQEYHFKVLIEILKKLGMDWADRLHHLSYGLVFLPEGKMKSREGKVVDADDIMQEVEDLAGEEIKKRTPDITDAELSERAKMIGLGALKFLLLRVTPTQSIRYDPREAIAFEGSTGPYVQYAHARICSIFEEETALAPDGIDFSGLVAPEEKAVTMALLDYPAVIWKAAEQYNPSLLCTYLIALAQAFNSFYHKHYILKADSEELKHARLGLAKAVQIVLRNGLAVLGIEAPEKM